MKYIYRVGRRSIDRAARALVDYPTQLILGHLICPPYKKMTPEIQF